VNGWTATCLALALLGAVEIRADEPLVFEDPRQEQRFIELTEELRCLVCQNQTLSDSDAPLAHDLRREIHGMMVAGRSDQEIKTFMVERYGDFVLYRPPMQSNTIVLWAAPLLLLLVGGAVVIRAVRKRAALLEDDDPSADANNEATGEKAP
jgi:cytochrome c-type biogenesis protein CcmH